MCGIRLTILIIKILYRLNIILVVLRNLVKGFSSTVILDYMSILISQGTCSSLIMILSTIYRQSINGVYKFLIFKCYQF